MSGKVYSFKLKLVAPMSIIFGIRDRRKAMLEDIATLTGAKVITREKENHKVLHWMVQLP